MKEALALKKKKKPFYYGKFQTQVKVEKMVSGTCMYTSLRFDDHQLMANLI